MLHNALQWGVNGPWSKFNLGLIQTGFISAVGWFQHHLLWSVNSVCTWVISHHSNNHSQQRAPASPPVIWILSCTVFLYVIPEFENSCLFFLIVLFFILSAQCEIRPVRRLDRLAPVHVVVSLNLLAWAKATRWTHLWKMNQNYPFKLHE